MRPPHGMTPHQLNEFLTSLGRFGVVVTTKWLQGYEFVIHLHALHNDHGTVRTAVIKQMFDFSMSEVSDILHSLNRLLRQLASDLDLRLDYEEKASSKPKSSGPKNPSTCSSDVWLT